MMWTSIVFSVVTFIVLFPLSVIISRWVFRVNQQVETQEKILKRLDQVLKAVEAIDDAAPIFTQKE